MSQRPEREARKEPRGAWETGPRLPGATPSPSDVGSDKMRYVNSTYGVFGPPEPRFAGLPVDPLPTPRVGFLFPTCRVIQPARSEIVRVGNQSPVRAFRRREFTPPRLTETGCSRDNPRQLRFPERIP